MIITNGNYNPNLVWINKIPKRFFVCVCVMNLVSEYIALLFNISNNIFDTNRVPFGSEKKGKLSFPFNLK